MRCASQGLRVTPWVADSVKPQIASSGSRVRPTTIAPASRSRRTISESSVAGSSKASVPFMLTSPATSTSSLIAIGTPSSGRSSPALRRASACSASSSAFSAKTLRKAFNCGSSRSIRTRCMWTSSVGETSPARIISAWRAAPAKATASSTSIRVCACVAIAGNPMSRRRSSYSSANYI